jgi:hypothetical protein
LVYTVALERILIVGGKVGAVGIDKLGDGLLPVLGSKELANWGTCIS